MASTEELQAFLSHYLGRVYSYGREGKYEHAITQEEIDALVSFNRYVDIAQDVIDYGMDHPDAPFWDFLDFIKPGVYGMTEEDLLEDDD